MTPRRRGPAPRPTEVLFFGHLAEVDWERCWEWIGARNSKGYGHFQAEGVHWLAHRYAYARLVGPIPPGLGLDHLCRVRHCCNPAHLEPVTTRENLLRGDTFIAHNVGRTHCPNGHPYDEENTYVSSRGFRACRICRAERDRRRRRA